MKLSDKMLVLFFALAVTATYLGVCVEYMFKVEFWPYIIGTEAIGILLSGVLGIKIILRLTKI